MKKLRLTAILHLSLPLQHRDINHGNSFHEEKEKYSFNICGAQYLLHSHWLGKYNCIGCRCQKQSEQPTSVEEKSTKEKKKKKKKKNKNAALHRISDLSTCAFRWPLCTCLIGKEAAVDAMVYSYRHGFSGFAAKLTESQARKIAELPGIVHIKRNQLHLLQTTRSWAYLRLSTHSPASLLHKGDIGDGIIIGFFDSGVWPESKVFDDEGYGLILKRWKGHCISGQLFNGTMDCNKKRIGAKWFIDGFLAESKEPFNTTERPDYCPQEISLAMAHTYLPLQLALLLVMLATKALS